MLLFRGTDKLVFRAAALAYDSIVMNVGRVPIPSHL
jgi:hypothetical protein